MEKKEQKIIRIKDDTTFLTNWPESIKKRIFKKYSMQGMVYLTKFGEGYTPTHVSDIVKWLDNLCITTISEKKSDKIAFDYLNDKYPEYKGFIQLF
jgi:hypothetical protein